MSLRAHLWAMDDAPVKNPTAALILIALSDEANDRGEGACPYMDKLIQRGRCSERSAQNHLRDLYRARLINFGDPAVARRRYNKAAGHAPRVWDLNLSATWNAVPQARSDEEMLEYSAWIGQRPVRREADQDEQGGVQILHPTNDVTPDDTRFPGSGGVQILHPTADQAILTDVNLNAGSVGCNHLHPRGATICTPGVQPVAPFPSEPFCIPKPPPTPPAATGTVTAACPDPRGEDFSTDQQTDPLNRIVDWFVNSRPDWDRRAIEDALTTSVARQLGTLAEAARALRDLADSRSTSDRYGITDSPRRLYALPNADWWGAARVGRAKAVAAQLAAAPHCSESGHERQPATGCKLCVGERKGGVDEDHTLDPDQALARGLRFLPASRRAVLEPAEEQAAVS
jgi:hypothetical protein